jgi:pimeloyl-ACP methyl ester carboxylesterase
MCPGRSLTSDRFWYAVVLLIVCLSSGCNHNARRPNWTREGIILGMEDRPKSNNLSRESLQVLYRENLLNEFHANPENAFTQLVAIILGDSKNQDDPKLLFTAAELANVLAERDAPFWNRRPHFPRRGKIPGPAPESATVQKMLPTKPEVLTFYSLASYLSYAFLASSSRSLGTEAFDPKFRHACELYNYSLEQTLRFTLDAIPFHPQAFYRLDDPNTPTRVQFKLVGFDWKESDIHEILPAVDYQTEEVGPSSRRHGLGVPLIGFRYRENKDSADFYPEVCAFPVTALYIPQETFNLQATETRDVIHLVNPYVQETVDAGESKIPIEADLSTPLNYLLTKTGFNSKIWGGFTGHQTNLRGAVFLIQPHRPGRIPVVLCHGLLSSSRPWETLVNGLMNDPWIRKYYEFWFMQYPTGRGILQNSADLRESLASVRARLDPKGEDPALDHMLMVGHSMGGLMAHVLASDSGDAFWNAAFSAPIDRLDLSGEERAELLRLLSFKRLPYIERVVFLAAPHRGSPFAQRPIGWLGSQLIDLPGSARSFFKSVTDKNKEHVKVPLDEDRLNSVSELRPDSETLSTLLALPRPEDVHYHNIIGDIQNRHNAPGDGVVPLESARIDWAESELVVPAEHTHIHEHPLVIKEMNRILKLHHKAVDMADRKE